MRGYSRIPAFYQKRQKIYHGLLGFVIIAGLPMLFVPGLRETLSDRVTAIRTAISLQTPPVVMTIGVDTEPFPEEYLKPEPPIRLPAQASASIRTIYPGEKSSVPSIKPQPQDQVVADTQRYRPLLLRDGPVAEATDAAIMQEKVEKGPVYSQGEKDREAYELVMRFNENLARMVRGEDPERYFKSWGSAHRGGDLYWVRVTFQMDESPDQEYIWEVNLESGRVSPLSFNARRIS
ncbi:MAG TPA: hypothetical protein VLL97_06065 [Acidobacteriota bacterium]|nr:hypothetical protein [Acidobacteriota bacterium]